MSELDTLVLHDLREGVATLTLNRPQQLNALNVPMMQALRLAVERAVGDPAAHVIVIRGAGDHFMAGGDLREFDAHLGLVPQARQQAFQAMIEQWINPAVLALRATHRPVLCAVQGACAGFGLSLMLACDLAFAAHDAYFATAYVSIGQSPDGGGSALLQRIVGARKAAELYLLGERIDARQALDLGIVNRVVPASELGTAVAELAARLARGPRHAYGEIKRLLAAAPERELAAQLQAEAEAFARCGATADFAEGVRAFLAKRKPGFSGG